MLGIISDSHGLLRPEVLTALQGVDRIIHAGDVGDHPAILDRLAEIAPVTAVRGNIAEDAHLPLSEVVELEGHRLYVFHILDDLDLDPVAAGFAAVIYGHSHQPQIERRNDVLYLNPGSIGQRRFKLPVSMAKLWIEAGALKAELITLPADTD
jgi:putative phosphoesterase